MLLTIQHETFNEQETTRGDESCSRGRVLLNCKLSCDVVLNNSFIASRCLLIHGLTPTNSGRPAMATRHSKSPSDSATPRISTKAFTIDTLINQMITSLIRTEKCTPQHRNCKRQTTTPRNINRWNGIIQKSRTGKLIKMQTSKTARPPLPIQKAKMKATNCPPSITQSRRRELSPI